MDDPRKYLQPETIAQIAGLELRARFIVEGFIAGLHKSPFHGFSVEFAEYRQYMPGDPIKNIDWKVYGKTDRYYIKEFEEETNLKAHLLLDISTSMNYGSGKVTKLSYAMDLAAAFTYLMIKQQDAVGLLTFGSTTRSYLPPRAKPSHMNDIFRTLAQVVPEEQTNISAVLHELAERIKRRGLIVLFSDLYDEPEMVLKALRHFRHRQHEVLVFHILDHQEHVFDIHKETIFVDLETGKKVMAQPWQIKKDYLEQMETFKKRYEAECRNSLIDYIAVDTKTPFDVALTTYLAKRAKLY